MSSHVISCHLMSCHWALISSAPSFWAAQRLSFSVFLSSSAPFQVAEVQGQGLGVVSVVLFSTWFPHGSDSNASTAILLECPLLNAIRFVPEPLLDFVSTFGLWKSRPPGGRAKFARPNFLADEDSTT